MRIIVFVMLLALTGCAGPQKTIWLRADGQSGSGDLVLFQQFELARTSCVGERQKTAQAGDGLAGAVAARDRGQATDQVLQACMAEKGYILVLEEDAEAKRQELAAIEAEKKLREASAAPTINRYISK